MNTYMTHLLLLNLSVNPWIVPSEAFTARGPYWCNFYGVSCLDAIGGLETVTYRPISAMYLEGLFLFGTIPFEIGFLPRLQILQMGNNLLYEGVPAALTACTDLRILKLDKNRLTGSSLENFKALKSLVYLNLTSNSLTGAIPPIFGLMSSLTSLSLGNNKIGYSIPPEITLLTKLKYLSLKNNDLVGPIPTSIGSLEGLTSLDLSNNRLTGSIPSQMTMLSSLDYFNISTNFLTSGRADTRLIDSAVLPRVRTSNYEFCNNCFNVLVSDYVICRIRNGCSSVLSPTPSPTPGKQNIKHSSNTKHDILTEENIV